MSRRPYHDFSAFYEAALLAEPSNRARLAPVYSMLAEGDYERAVRALLSLYRGMLDALKADEEGARAEAFNFWLLVGARQFEVFPEPDVARALERLGNGFFKEFACEAMALCDPELSRGEVPVQELEGLLERFASAPHAWRSR